MGCHLLHHFLPKTCGPRMSQAPVAQSSVGCPTGDGRPVPWCGRGTRTGTSSAWATTPVLLHGRPRRPSAQLPCLHAALGLPLQSLLACFLWVSFHLTSPCPAPSPPASSPALPLVSAAFRTCLEVGTMVAETAAWPYSACFPVCCLPCCSSGLQDTCFCELKLLALCGLGSEEKVWERVINLFPYIDAWAASSVPARSGGRGSQESEAGGCGLGKLSEDSWSWQPLGRGPRASHLNTME